MAFFRDMVPGTRDGQPAPAPSVPRQPERESAEPVRRAVERPAEPRPTENRSEMRADPAPAPTQPAPAHAAAAHPGPAHAAPRADVRESMIGPELTLEGKVEGVGHLRIAGRFKGDIHVQGNLTIEAGAQVAGQVRAKQVIVAGTLDGNIEGAERVELQQTGVLNGDLKAGSLVVAGGSRMRGQVEFGWGDKSSSSGGATAATLAKG